MIVASVHVGDDSATLTWKPGLGTTLTGGGRALDTLHAILTPGMTPVYSPARGGWYRGFDPNDGREVRDALEELRKSGRATVQVHADAVGFDAPLPWATLDGNDYRDEAVRRAAMVNHDPALPRSRRIFLRARMAKAAQLSMFGVPPARPMERPAPTSTSTATATKPAVQAPAAKVTAKPPGAGWTPIPGSRHGGYHRPKKAGGGFEYWYPGEGVRATPRDLSEQFQLRPQEAGRDDGSTRKKHKDVGVKVGAARKDKWASVHAGNLQALELEGELEANKRTTKAAVLGAHDPERDRAFGDTPGASLLKRAIYAKVGAKPVGTVDPRAGRAVWTLLRQFDNNLRLVGALLAGAAGRELYVSACDKLAKGLDDCRTVADIEAYLDDLEAIAATGAYETRELATPQVADDLARRFPASGAESRQFLSGTAGGVAIDADALKAAGYDIVYVAGKAHVHRRLADPLQAYRPTLEAVSLGKGWFSDVLQSRHKGAFNDARRAARKAERDNDWSELFPDAKAGTETAKPKAKPFVLTRGEGTPERVGGQKVPPLVDGKMLAETFGLRAVEYGNWVDDAGAAAHLHHAYGALLDLAELMQIDPRHVAHGGRLAMAFGARGGGRFGAHYEPGRQVINLTHTRGGGSLAHEWAHYIDHMLSGGGTASDAKGDARMSALSHSDRGGTVHPEVHASFGRVMRAIHDPSPESTAAHARAKADHEAEYNALTKELTRIRGLTGEERTKASAAYGARREAWMAARARIHNGGAGSKFAGDAFVLGEYWHRDHELFARAFESWAEDRLTESGRKSTYLVTDTTKRWNVSKAHKGDVIDGLEPYPAGDERRTINKAIDELVATLARTGDLRKALARAALRRPPAGFQIKGRL